MLVNLSFMELSIRANPRTVLGKQNKKLRAAGKLPAVLYGKGKDSVALEVPQKEFEKVYRQTGESTLVNLVIEGDGERKVLIHEVAKHFMKDEPIHVDFYEVDLTRKIHAKIPLHFVGASPAVKELSGILIKNLNEIEVEALPADLPPFIEVHIEDLKTFADLLRVSDVKVSDKIKVLGHAEDVVVSVQAPRTEEELAELEKPTAEVEKAAIEGMAAEEKKPEAGEEEEAAEKAPPEKPEKEEKAEAAKPEKAEK